MEQLKLRLGASGGADLLHMLLLQSTLIEDSPQRMKKSQGDEEALAHEGLGSGSRRDENQEGPRFRCSMEMDGCEGSIHQGNNL